MNHFLSRCLLLLLALPLSLVAQNNVPNEVFVASDSVAGLTGTARLGAVNAYIHVPSDMQLLDRTDAAHLLEVYWGNPADSSILGALVPAEAKIFADIEFGFVIYNPCPGRVNIDDADKIDSTEVLRVIQYNEHRRAEKAASEGFSHVSVDGWLRTPQFDLASHSLRWATCFRTWDDEGHGATALNYDIRILGRDCYIKITAAAAIDAFAQGYLNEAEALAGAIEFDPGHRYDDTQKPEHFDIRLVDLMTDGLRLPDDSWRLWAMGIAVLIAAIALFLCFRLRDK